MLVKSRIIEHLRSALSITLWVTACGSALAAGTALPVQLEKAPVSIHDQASIIRGGKYYAQNCMTCHAARYLRYDKLAKQAGVLYDKMPLDHSRWTLGTPPPDLSLVARVRGADWLYTYFHSFYSDSKSPTGANNLIFANSSMPNVFLAQQGKQVLITDKVQHARSQSILDKPHWYNRLELVSKGTMTPAEFDKLTVDLVNFLVYAGEPHQAERRTLGWWVLGFLVILFSLAFMLKREYWRDIKK